MSTSVAAQRRIPVVDDAPAMLVELGPGALDWVLPVLGHDIAADRFRILAVLAIVLGDAA